jgi:hypothetical protein
MSRILITTCLILFASSALAKSPAAATDPADGSAKPGKVVSAAGDGDAPSPVHPAVVPARSAPLPTRGGAPRWHSLLPGMIR